MKFMVSRVERSINYPIYSTPTDLEFFILCNSDNNEIQNELIDKMPKPNNDNIFHESYWHLDFDGSVNKSGAIAGVWITNMETNHSEGHSFRLNFKCTNNMVDYSVYNARLARYKDTTIDLTDDLLECKFASIPRKQNIQAHYLTTFSSTCNLPFQPTHRYIAEIKHKPIIPYNLKYWQIFSQDEQIYHFLNNEREFQNCKIDTDCEIDSYFDCQIDNIDVHKFNKPTVFTQSDIDNLENIYVEKIIEEEIDMLDLKDNFLPKGLTPL